MPLNISVLICTYGDQEWKDVAERARASVEGQGRYGDHVYVHHMDKGTLAEVRNRAAEVAKGDLLVFIDADDCLADGYLYAMHRKLFSWNMYRRADMRENPLLLVPSICYLDEHGNAAQDPTIPAWDRSLIDLNCAVIGTLVPRDLFLSVGGFRDLPALEDWDMWLRCVKAGARMVPVRDAVYVAKAGGSGRNLDQSPYYAIRAEHEHAFPWHDISSYKVG